MDSIITIYNERMKGCHCLYVLRLPHIVIDGRRGTTPVYKFGITSNIGARLQTHSRNLKFTDIIAVRAFDSRVELLQMERRVKHLAESHAERVNIMGNTELIETHNIAKYIHEIYREASPRPFVTGKVDNIAPDDSDNGLFDRALEELILAMKNLSIGEKEPIAPPSIVINNHINITIDEKACRGCGKKFRTSAELLRHNNRKSKCVAKKVTNEGIFNPLRCSKCHKLFSNINNRNKHFELCKPKK